MKKKELIYKNIKSLSPLMGVMGEANAALQDKSRTIKTSEIPELLGAIAGGSVGVGAGFAIVSAAGYTGLSAAGITSGLATLGALVGGGMAAGIFVAGLPMALLGIFGYGLLSRRNKRKLKQLKEALLQEAIKKHDAIIRELNQKANLAEDRMTYLESLNILLQRAVQDLEADLAV